MEEAKGAIARVRDYGETLKSGAPHQIDLGADIVIVADLAKMSTQPAVTPSNLVEQLQAKLAQADTLYRDLLTEHETLKAEHADLDLKYLELVADHDRLTSAKVDLETELKHCLANPNTASSREKFGEALSEAITKANARADLQIGAVLGGSAPQPDDDALRNEPQRQKADTSTDLLGDKQLTKAERKAQAKAATAAKT